MKKKKRNNDFSLSFLDIMACGLGGVIIIFLLLDNSKLETQISNHNQINNDNLESSNKNSKSSKKNKILPGKH